MENLNIDVPKFEKWNQLPPELKLETIKKLDCKTRCNLRITRHLEKVLVDSQKFHIDKFQLYPDLSRLRSSLRTHYKHGSQEKLKMYDSGVDIIPLFEYITKHAIIGELYILFTGNLVNMTDKLRPIPWTVKCLKLRCEKKEDLNFCLERVNDSQKIEIDACVAVGFSFDNLLTIPQIIKVPFFEISEMSQPDIQNVYKLAMIWIEKDAKIGQKFGLDCFDYGEYEDFDGFVETFSTRVVQTKTADLRALEYTQILRIRTDNPSKHILFQLVDLDYIEDGGSYLHMTVIPADMKETEYDMKWFNTFEM